MSQRAIILIHVVLLIGTLLLLLLFAPGGW